MDAEQKKQMVSNALDEYCDTVFRVALIHLKSYADAEDAVQEVFLKLYHTDTTFNDTEHVKAWLLRVTINYCNSILRSSWHRRVFAADEVLTSVEDEYKRGIVSSVLELPVKYRDVIYLYYYEGYSTAEISALMKVKEPTVRTRLVRGRALLKTQLGGIEDEI